MPQHQHASSSYIPYGTACKNLFLHHNISSLVIISLILMTCMFDQAVLLLGETGCGSLMGLKGLKDACRARKYTCSGQPYRTFSSLAPQE